MTQAPERIWAAQNKTTGATMWWPDNNAGGTEYVRADISHTVKPPFQSRVEPWMMECFGEEISADTQERLCKVGFGYDLTKEDRATLSALAAERDALRAELAEAKADILEEAKEACESRASLLSEMGDHDGESAALLCAADIGALKKGGQS